MLDIGRATIINTKFEHGIGRCCLNMSTPIAHVCYYGSCSAQSEGGKHLCAEHQSPRYICGMNDCNLMLHNVASMISGLCFLHRGGDDHRYKI